MLASLAPRPTWDLEVFQPIAGNYYPVGAAIFIEDDESSFAVMNDRTQGGASLSSGSVEIMVQRRIVADDSRGVGEPLDETTGGVTPYPPYGEAERVGDGVIIKGVHRIAVGAGKSGASTARGIMDETFSPLNLFFTSVPKGTDFQADHVLQAHFRNVAAVLPKQIRYGATNSRQRSRAQKRSARAKRLQKRAGQRSERERERKQELDLVQRPTPTTAFLALAPPPP